MEMYTEFLSSSFNGLTFPEAAEYVLGYLRTPPTIYNNKQTDEQTQQNICFTLKMLRDTENSIWLFWLHHGSLESPVCTKSISIYFIVFSKLKHIKSCREMCYVCYIVFMPPPFEEWWRGIKCYPCPCVRSSVRSTVRPLSKFGVRSITFERLHRFDSNLVCLYKTSKHRSSLIWVTTHWFFTELWAFYKNIAQKLVSAQ